MEFCEPPKAYFFGYMIHRLLLAALERMPSGRAVRWSLDVDPIDLF